MDLILLHKWANDRFIVSLAVNEKKSMAKHNGILHKLLIALILINIIYLLRDGKKTVELCEKFRNFLKICVKRTI